MTKKYFLSSDIHSFYSEYMTGLRLAKFDINNPEHILVILGDLFDRGLESVELYNFIRYSIPKERRILIKGNHEELICNALERGYLTRADEYNGTTRTLYDMAKASYPKGQEMTLKDASNLEFNTLGKEVYDWINSTEWVDFYEIGDCVLVHSFIPLINLQGVNIYDCYDSGYSRYFKYNPDWRTTATQKEWNDSRWGCPWKQFNDGLFKEESDKGKTLICGHWHTADFYENLKLEYNPDNDIYIDDSKHLIGLDSCTALTRKVNVLVLDEKGKIIKVIN